MNPCIILLFKIQKHIIYILKNMKSSLVRHQLNFHMYAIEASSVKTPVKKCGKIYDFKKDFHEMRRIIHID